MDLAKYKLSSKYGDSYGSEIYKIFPIPFVRLCSLVITHFSIALFSTFFLLLIKIRLCADAHLEPSQTTTTMIIWSFPFLRCFQQQFKKQQDLQTNIYKILQNPQENTSDRVSLWCNFFRVIEIQKVRARHKIANRYSATKRTHLYCKWASFKFSIWSSHLNIPSFTKYLILTLVFMWNSALRERFNFCCWRGFC